MNFARVFSPKSFQPSDASVMIAEHGKRGAVALQRYRLGGSEEDKTAAITHLQRALAVERSARRRPQQEEAQRQQHEQRQQSGGEAARDRVAHQRM